MSVRAESMACAPLRTGEQRQIRLLDHRDGSGWWKLELNFGVGGTVGMWLTGDDVSRLAAIATLMLHGTETEVTDG